MGEEEMEAFPAREQHMQSALLQRKNQGGCSVCLEVALTLGVERSPVARGEALYGATVSEVLPWPDAPLRTWYFVLEPRGGRWAVKGYK